jgi:Integrase core domain
LRRELLDHVAPFESLLAAPEAIDGWVHSYNHQHRHQSLDMATPASAFRPHGPSCGDQLPAPGRPPGEMPAGQLQIGVIEPPPTVPPGGAPVEFEVLVPPSGQAEPGPGQAARLSEPGPAGRTLTIRADLRSIHLLLDWHVLRTVASRLPPARAA